MAALSRSYTSHAEALGAVNAVLGAGIPGGGGGSFADADRDEIVSYPGGVEHARYAGPHGVKEVLTEAGLDDAAAERDINALQAGRVLVLVTAPDEEAGRVRTLLDG